MHSFTLNLSLQQQQQGSDFCLFSARLFVVQLQPGTTFATDLSSTRIRVYVTPRLVIMCLDDLTPRQRSEIHDSTLHNKSPNHHHRLAITAQPCQLVIRCECSLILTYSSTNLLTDEILEGPWYLLAPHTSPDFINLPYFCAFVKQPG